MIFIGDNDARVISRLRETRAVLADRSSQSCSGSVYSIWHNRSHACIATRPQIRNTRQARGKHTLKRKGPGDLSLRPFLGALLHALDSVVAGVVHLGCARPRRVQRKSWLIACEGLRAIEEAFGRYGATSPRTKKAFSGIKTSFCFCGILGGVREYPGASKCAYGPNGVSWGVGGIGEKHVLHDPGRTGQQN